jgi:hypothetical protein
MSNVSSSSTCAARDATKEQRHLDDVLWLRRARSVGNRRQLLNMIT